jgi:hypothetical protein
MQEKGSELNGGSTTSSGDSGDSAGMVYAEGGENLVRSEGRTGSSGSSDKPAVEGTNANVDISRGYATLRAAIGAGLIKGDRSERNRKERAPVTTPTIIAAAIASVSIVFIIIGLYPFIFNLVLGQPFTYTNVPFPICDPFVKYDTEDVCVRPSAQFMWQSGQIVPFYVGVCYNNPFSVSGELTYTFKRRLVNDNDGTIIPMDDSFTNASRGCVIKRITLNPIPERAYPGTWHFEGVSEVTTWRLEEIPWRSVSFLVGP